MTAGLQRKIDELQRQILAIKKRLSPAALSGTVTPAPHAATHEEGGSDEVDITLLGGFPGGTTDFLREDGTFATPSGGSGITELTSDVTAGPGSGSQVATIANDAVTNAKAANMAQATIKGRAAAAGTGDPTDLTPNQTSTILDGATDPFLRTSAAGSSYTDEQAQDAVGGILDDGGDIDFTYDDGTPKITGSIKSTSAFRTKTIRFTFNDLTANSKVRLTIPIACTIISSRIFSDVSGSAVVDIWKDTWANYPPTVADTITASAKPTLSSQTHVEDATLTGWSLNIAAGDALIGNLDSSSGVGQVVVELKVGI